MTNLPAVRLQGMFWLAALALAGGCQQPPPGPPPAVPSVAAAAVAASHDDDQGARYTGTVRPHRRLDLAFRVGGYVQSVLSVRDIGGGLRPVQAGDTVQAGTVLARLQSTDFRAQSAAAGAETDAARATVGQARDKQVQAREAERQATDAVAEARAGLQAAQAERAQAVSGIGQGRAGVAEAQAGMTLAQDDFTRTDDLYRSGSATQPQEDAARAGRDSAVAKHQAAQQALAAAQGRAAEADAHLRVGQAHIRQAQSAVAAARAARTEAGDAIATAQAQVAQADANQAAQAVPVAQTVMRAPITGVVLARKIEVGSLVGPGSPAFSLAETRRLDVTFGLPEKEAARVRVGRPVDLTLGLGDNVHAVGTVTEVAPASDEKTGVFGVRVSFPNPAGATKVGMIATAQFDDEAHAQAGLTVPISALIQSHDRPDGEAVLLILTDHGQSTVHLRDVELGPSRGDRIVVRGLNPGARVVATAPGLLSDGQTVRITASGTESQ